MSEIDTDQRRFLLGVVEESPVAFAPSTGPLNLCDEMQSSDEFSEIPQFW